MIQNIPPVRIVGPISDFDEVMTAQRTQLIELKSSVDTVSDIRNVVTVTGSAAAAVENSEFKLSTTAAASDKVAFDSAERGRYAPGFSALAGIGLRTASGTTFTGTSSLEWGYFNGTDGFGFGADSSGNYVFVLRSGTKTKIRQADWNVDRLDGSAGSAFNLDLEFGQIFHIRFSWYGHGSVQFSVVRYQQGNQPIQKEYICHIYSADGETSIEQPNCPLSVVLDNGDSAVVRNVFVSGRQFSIMGNYDPTVRITGIRRVGQGSIGTSAWVPVIGVRRKSSSKFLAQSVKLFDVQILTDSTMLIGFVTGPDSVTDQSWEAVTDQQSDETVLEQDVSGTAITLTNAVWVGGLHLVAGSNRADFINAVRGVRFDLIEDEPVYVVALRTGASGGTINSATLNMIEEW